MSLIADKLFNFYKDLDLSLQIKTGIQVLNPYKENSVLNINKSFYSNFYADNNTRILILGINPGRFGAGITGISFTDPIQLDQHLGFKNPFDKKPELSATFIHDAIREYGGPKKFYSKFHLSAVSPLGFVKNGININYYDDNDLLTEVKPFIIKSIFKQLEILGNRSICICIGQGKNLDFLKKLNQDYKWFEKIEILPHPRWILQYRRKQKNEFIQKYIRIFNI
jgi:hypothetical protein